MNIYICGYMGVGKTTIGKDLSKRLEMEFVDLDEEIEKEVGLKVWEIFETKGEDYFREQESKILKRVIKEKNKNIISLGGGTVCEINNLNSILAKGILVYLKADEEFLAERLKMDSEKRPLLKSIEPGSFLQYVQSTLPRREQFYSLSQVETLVNAGFSPEKLLNRLKLSTIP